MKIVLTGGGTAGHVTPALAIAETLLENDPGAEILYIGTPNGMEKRLAEKEGYRYASVRAAGFSRSLSPKNIRSLWYALVSPVRAERILRLFAPDLVVGTGGYVCYPVLCAAARLGIPCALHESNALPGLATRRLARRVDLVMLNFAEAAGALPEGTHTLRTGNPVRKGFRTQNRADSRRALGIPEKARLILSFGGSLGAQAINRAALLLTEKYALPRQDVYQIHGSGTRYREETEREIAARFGPLPRRIRYSAYLDNMPVLMAAADLLICRAGAMTVTEAALSGRATLLIPSPNVAGNHQTKNALAMVNAGGAVLLRESELNETTLLAAVERVLCHPGEQERMEKAARRFAVPDANRRIYETLLSLVGNRRNG